MKREPIVWGECPLDDGETRSFLCGNIVVDCKRSGTEVILASRNKSELEAATDCDGNNPQWTRWAVCNEVKEVRFVPRFPDLPLLVEPEAPFRVTPGAEARVFLSIPVSVVVFVRDPKEQELTVFPTETLSHTWFGETDSGELCYSLPSKALRKPLDHPSDASVQAPVIIRNESNEILEVKRICLRLNGLAIHRKDEKLWTNETLVRYQGGPSVSRIEVQSGPPPEAVGGDRLVSAKEQGAREMVARTFRSLRRWTSDLLDID